MSIDELLKALQSLSDRGYGEYAIIIELPGQKLWVSDISDPNTDQLEVELEVSA